MEKAKTATMKIFEYSSLGKELKVQTDIAKKTISNVRQNL